MLRELQTSPYRAVDDRSDTWNGAAGANGFDALGESPLIFGRGQTKVRIDSRFERHNWAALAQTSRYFFAGLNQALG